MANTVKLDKLCPGIFGISERRYRQLAQEGIVPPVEDGLVDFIAATKHLIAYYQKLVEGQGAITLTEERARLTKFQAEKAKMETERMQETLVEASEVEKRWLALGQACRARLLGIPGKSSPRLVGCTVNEMKQILEENIHEALNELADRLGANVPEAPAAEAPAVEAAAPETVVAVEVAAPVMPAGSVENGSTGKCVGCGQKISSRSVRCRRCAGKLNAVGWPEKSAVKYEKQSR